MSNENKRTLGLSLIAFMFILNIGVVSMGQGIVTGDNAFEFKRPAEAGSTAPKANYAKKGPLPRRKLQAVKSPAASSTKANPETASLTATNEQLGITLWRLRPERSGEDGARLLTQGSSSKDGKMVAERVGMETTFKMGEKVRISVESPRAGYLYIIDREVRKDGTLRDPYLIFPTLRARGGDNQVRAGKVIEIPAQTDDPFYFDITAMDPHYAGELLTVLVSPTKIEGLPLENGPIKLSTSLVEKWENEWERAATTFELNAGEKMKYTEEEKEAGSGTRLLTQKSPSPQNVISIDVPKGKSFLVSFTMRVGDSVQKLAKLPQQSVLKNNEPIDRDLPDVLIEGEPIYRKLADGFITEGRLPEAQTVLDLLKEEEFKKIVRRSAEPVNALPYSRAEQAATSLVDRLVALGREMYDLKAKPADALSAAERKRLGEIESADIPAANRALRQAIEALSSVAPDVKNALDLKIKDNIQNILPALGERTVALYTVIGKTIVERTGSSKLNVGWILLVTPEIRKAYPIDTVDLEQTVFNLRVALRSPKYDPRPLSGELYKKLFLQTSAKQKTTLAADLETHFGTQKDKTLMWSLDGVLRYVPMAALHDGDGYLVEKYRNVVFNTASLGSLKDAPKRNWEVVGLGVSGEGIVNASDGTTLRFSALHGAETELNSIIKETNRTDAEGIFPGTLKINKEFTREALLEGARTGMPVVHISSHFWFNPAREETSFLLLGNSVRLEMTEFQDYPNLFSTVDFLSLSACDTATGGNINGPQDGRGPNGKEIEGFAYVAQTLGAKSVMASLWPVSDIGTKELMLKFYQIRKAQPDLAKGEALRQSQLTLLHGTIKSQKAGSGQRDLTQRESGTKVGIPLLTFVKDADRPFAHPHYWSPFILIGNWR